MKPAGRFLAAFALALIAACDAATAPAEGAIAVEIASLERDLEMQSPVLVLRETHGHRELPIWIGEPEARSIAMALHGIEPVRPNAHDLSQALLDGSGGRVLRVVVNDLRDGIFYAQIVVATDAGTHEIDARPSDAVALAVRTGAPIEVHVSVLERAAKTPGLDAPRDDRQVPSRSL